ncbi:DNA polymerase domain-containing protein [Methanocaldococcus sp.]
MINVLLDNTYKTEKERAVIYLYLLNTILKDKEFKPYFYVELYEDAKEEDIDKIKTFLLRKDLLKFVEDIKIVKKKILKKEKDILKIISIHPQKVPKLRKIKEFEEVKEIYEHDIPFAKRYMIDNNIVPLTYFDFDKKRVVDNKIPDLKMVAFDIETIDNKIIMASFFDERGGEVLTYKDFKHESVKLVRDEKDLILKIVEKLKDYDIIFTYNGDYFDFPFLKERAKFYGIKLKLGRDGEELKIKKGVESKAYIPGRVHVDLYPISKRLLRLTKYTLEDVVYNLFGIEKLKIKDFEMYWEEKDETLVEYSLQDAKYTYLIGKYFLPLEIMFSRIINQVLFEITRMSSSQMVEYLLMKKAYLLNYIVPNKPDEKEYKKRLAESYEGGYVKEPIRGIHENIVYLDFKSLYPTIIISYNISPDTLDCDCCKDESEKILNHWFCKKKIGLVPLTVKELVERRAKIKKKLKTEKNKLLDYEQQSLKILANSVYGYLAYPRARFYNKVCAEIITYLGRKYIIETIEEAEKFGFLVLYADSVTEDTEIIVKINNEIKFIKIKDLFKKVDYTIGEKEYCILNSVYALTLDDNGKLVWKRVPYVMRHKTNKDVYRVWITNSWYVDVTEDHSLIGYLNTSKKRNTKKIGDRFIRIIPNNIGKEVKSLITINNSLIDDKPVNNVSIKFWELVGLLIGDGSWGGKTNYYLRLSTGLDKDEIIKKVLEPLKEVGVISNYYFENEKGDVRILSKKLVKFMNKFKDENNEKIIPEFMFKLSKRKIEAFLRGLFSADGTVIVRRGNAEIRFTNTNENIIGNVRKLLYLVGISNSFFKENNPNKYGEKICKTFSYHVNIKNKLRFAERIGFILDRKNKRLINLNNKWKSTIRGYDFDIVRVKKVEKIDYNGYVYDIEVEDTHRFFANGILVHNTDGVFLTIKGKDREYILKRAKEFVKYINNKLPGDMELEFEGFFKRGIFITKKKYALITENDEIIIKGLEFVRRDWSGIAKKTQREVLEALLKYGDIERAKKIIKEAIKRLREKKIKKEDLIIYTQLTKDIKEYKSTAPHVELAKRLIREGKKIKPGDVLEYIIVKGAKQISDRAKLPDEVDIEDVDINYYIDNQILPPVLRIMESLGVSEKELKQEKQLTLDKFF